MSKISRGFKYRVYPTAEQEIVFAKNFGCKRFVYNYFLNLRKEKYEKEKVTLNYTACCKMLTDLKSIHPWLYEADSTALQKSIRALDNAYKAFFEGNTKYPTYKSKKTNRYSYTSVNNKNSIRIEDNCIVIPKVGKVKAKLHRAIPDGFKIDNATISKNPAGEYYISLSCEKETDIPSKDVKKVIGMDFSMGMLFVSTDDKIKTDPKFLHRYKQSHQKLAAAQRTLSRRTPGSNGYEKQRIKVAKLHQKITRQREDYLHKLALQIANEYDLVCVEDIDVKSMASIKNTYRFGKSIADNGWSKFLKFVEYKLNEQGKHLQKVNKWYPSSKTCNKCDNIYKELTLKEREWACPKCGIVHDRDLNAAINIKKEGYRLYALSA